MSKNNQIYVCNSCGSIYNKWQGKCDACGEWNTITEDKTQKSSAVFIKSKNKANKLDFSSLTSKEEKTPQRTITNIKELDRVCGGGLVSGSVILVGGDPGIGKSTLLLQMSANTANLGKNSLYISGEEAPHQIRLRASRLGLDKCPVKLAASSNIKEILATLEDSADKPDIVIIDSIQTMFLDELDSAPGTVSQVRACAFELIKMAKKIGFVLFLVGHVTKEGTIAGPRVLEHMVDTVLYFEGDRGHHFRILRAVKNRFGATDEIGVFEMTEKGLIEVSNPSALFLAERKGNVSGSCVFAGIEGSRPMLVEIQALVAPSSGNGSKRACVGFDSNRLSMILAVLDTRCGLNIGTNDIFINVAGGLKITEPAADIAVAAALISSFTNIPASAEGIFFGEIGLSGEIRAVPQPDLRLKEAKKLGFKEAFIPKSIKKKDSFNQNNIIIKEIGHLQTLLTGIKNGNI